MNANVERLKAARDLIARPGGWIQHDAALTADGNFVGFLDDGAVCFCSLGALWRVCGSADKADDLRRFVGLACGQYAVARWNDVPGRTQPEVVSVFDRAIELAELEA